MPPVTGHNHATTRQTPGRALLSPGFVLARQSYTAIEVDHLSTRHGPRMIASQRTLATSTEALRPIAWAGSEVAPVDSRHANIADVRTRIGAMIMTQTRGSLGALGRCAR